jgi:predicted ATP-grasp superfamily ATP-dependent carboligase
MNILITSWRSFVALEMMRLLKNHTIFIQECQEEYICKYSKYKHWDCITSSPSEYFEIYKAQILDYIQKNNIKLIIPTTEDIFYISRLKSNIEALGCMLISDDFEKLKKLHSKKQIMEMSEGLWIEIPKTFEFFTLEELKNYIDSHRDFNYVVKPKYSRFANFISSNKITGSKSLDDIKIDLSNNSYIFQEYISGKSACSYSLAKKWTLISHMNYECVLTYKGWSGTFLESFQNETIENFVKVFCKKYKINWQIAFDYIISADGKVYLIECNPRPTSGIHLFKKDTEFQKRIQDFKTQEKQTLYSLRAGIKNGFSFINLIYTFQIKFFFTWIESLGYDVVFDLADIKPFFKQLILLRYYKKLAREKHMTISEVTSYDIEYNGN